MPKIVDVRSATTPEDFDLRARPRAAEVHPEVSFCALAGRPMVFGKKLGPGVAERVALLEERFPNFWEAALRMTPGARPLPGFDDMLDAAAAAWSARRLVSGEAIRLGGHQCDTEGYPMNIWM